MPAAGVSSRRTGQVQRSHHSRTRHDKPAGVRAALAGRTSAAQARIVPERYRPLTTPRAARYTLKIQVPHVRPAAHHKYRAYRLLE
eukprot:6190055-Pleurochrysis_carterae.AAC.2